MDATPSQIPKASTGRGLGQQLPQPSQWSGLDMGASGRGDAGACVWLLLCVPSPVLVPVLMRTTVYTSTCMFVYAQFLHESKTSSRARRQERRPARHW